MNMLAAVLGFALSSSTAFAVAPTQGVEAPPFQAPAGWNCKQDKSAWVCRSTRPELTQDAFMVITAVPRQPSITCLVVSIAK